SLRSKMQEARRKSSPQRIVAAPFANAVDQMALCRTGDRESRAIRECSTARFGARSRTSPHLRTMRPPVWQARQWMGTRSDALVSLPLKPGRRADDRNVRASPKWRLLLAQVGAVHH